MKLKNLRSREVQALIEARGWKLLKSNGSHHNFVHPGSLYKITIPGNAGHSVSNGVLAQVKRILKSQIG